ncbi:30S ribosomal protein S18 [bacterium (Candidatus Gribaldobacteria) CG08_land_8_20_14_0_20_39_15]|uniref:Small ribosomal subunit protein bS18 n=1 Tax=bacterium (Candidatus Gribaldobacteria) CG08_land_8_20_14_0_20_39_15 TaxID=2014273 RepID=A0A2M6XUH1_9BACT|nr:MAG: 30S ribosomal protein S18 [bacterium (Candidatus Gribaldobacteria) CG08_land_8_20_14_0_20_39_15]
MHCYFCQKGIKGEVDFKETALLKKFTAVSAKIRSRKKTGLCAKHQRDLTRAIKRARFLALLPFVRE